MKIKPLLSSMLTLSLFISLSTQASVITQIKPNYVSSNYAQTKYPIVLTHGMFGFSRLGTQAFGMDYWYQIVPDLARNGAQVYATQVSPLNSTEIRGEQLLQQVDEIIALTGKPKVNLFGHSHGGPTSQYVEAVAPDKVASVTAIAGAMHGAEFADNMLKYQVVAVPLSKIFNIIGTAESYLQGNPNLPNDATASLKSLSTQGTAIFNAKYATTATPSNCNISNSGQKITSNGIHHYSWTGDRQVTNLFDVLDTALMTIVPALFMGTASNDGILSVCTANYGQVIRNDYEHNHFDEVNQVLGLRGLFSQDPVALFRQHANRLKLQGL
ncbi:triacylglycerol lipase [Acinetobacter wuhouensis]|uniref:esterase/lipase family protein n=1 Tax=Acinetobacter wuhouensis TaxID=1879050 RepID=UPI0010237807|nr:triacylglycerol lipase [Acinetobacter wuhouensis]RZG72667.1 triacylglycerol lipase [Acinetobacter wuhouensis]